jgi:hypothetical protein
VLTPVLFLPRVGTVPGGLALRAYLEVLPMAHDLAPVVDAIRSPLHRSSGKLLVGFKNTCWLASAEASAEASAGHFWFLIGF